MIAALALLAAIVAPPAPTGYVTDNAGALSSSAANRIAAELQSYENTTGHRIIVWIGQTTGDVPLEDYTIHAAEQWKIYKKQHRDDNAILFIFMQDHKVRIEVGYGLEPTLTDAASSRIIRDTIRPKMRAGDVDGAVQGGVDDMLLTVTPSFASKIGHAVATPSPENASEPSNRWVVVLVFGGILLFWGVFALIWVAAARGRKAGHAGFGAGWVLGSLSSGGWGSGGSNFGGGGFSGGFGGGFGGGGASGGW